MLEKVPWVLDLILKWRLILIITGQIFIEIGLKIIFKMIIKKEAYSH